MPEWMMIVGAISAGLGLFAFAMALWHARKHDARWFLFHHEEPPR